MDEKKRAELMRARRLPDYKRMTTCVPEHPEIREYISPGRKVIYTNTAAGAGAKITQLIR